MQIIKVDSEEFCFYTDQQYLLIQRMQMQRKSYWVFVMWNILDLPTWGSSKQYSNNLCINWKLCPRGFTMNNADMQVPN